VPIGAEGIDFITKKQHKMAIYHIHAYVRLILLISLNKESLFTHAKKYSDTLLKRKNRNMTEVIPANLSGTV
jgi:hypothetical protein